MNLEFRLWEKKWSCDWATAYGSPILSRTVPIPSIASPREWISFRRVVTISGADYPADGVPGPSRSGPGTMAPDILARSLTKSRQGSADQLVRNSGFTVTVECTIRVKLQSTSRAWTDGRQLNSRLSRPRTVTLRLSPGPSS